MVAAKLWYQQIGQRVLVQELQNDGRPTLTWSSCTSLGRSKWERNGCAVEFINDNQYEALLKHSIQQQRQSDVVWIVSGVWPDAEEDLVEP